jgi:hypothetical protein
LSFSLLTCRIKRDTLAEDSLRPGQLVTFQVETNLEDLNIELGDPSEDRITPDLKVQGLGWAVYL